MCVYICVYIYYICVNIYTYTYINDVRHSSGATSHSWMKGTWHIHMFVITHTEKLLMKYVNICTYLIQKKNLCTYLYTTHACACDHTHEISANLAQILAILGKLLTNWCTLVYRSMYIYAPLYMYIYECIYAYIDVSIYITDARYFAMPRWDWSEFI